MSISNLRSKEHIAEIRRKTAKKSANKMKCCLLWLKDKRNGGKHGPYNPVTWRVNSECEMEFLVQI